MAYRLTLSGNTYGIKETLKGLKFTWDSSAKAWRSVLETEEEAKELATRWVSEGVYGRVEKFVEKRYMVKEDWIFNLESMHDKVWNLVYSVRNKEIKLPFEVAGRTIKSEDDLFALQDEAAELEWKAKSNRGVTGKEYGRIKSIVSWRVLARYTACMAAGMEESEAGRCFEEM